MPVIVQNFIGQTMYEKKVTKHIKLSVTDRPTIVGPKRYDIYYYLWSPYVIGQTIIYFHPVVSYGRPM